MQDLLIHCLIVSSDESMRLHCEFDIYVGEHADDIRDAVFKNFYSIAIMN